MDIHFNQQKRKNNYYYALGQSAAINLIDLSKRVSFRNIDDVILRSKFQYEIKKFTELNLNCIFNSKNGKECKIAINNIKDEYSNLEQQDTMLRLEKAKIFITVGMEKFEDEMTYTINAIGVIIGGLQIIGGYGIISNAAVIGNSIGKLVGSYIILEGVSSSIENIKKLAGEPDAVGFLRQTYHRTAQFLGFKRSSGEIAYNLVNISTSTYGLFNLRLSSDAWRLFRYLPTDHYRKITKMSRNSLALNIIGTGNKIRVIHGEHHNG